jgi:hypothetical protein
MKKMEVFYDFVLAHILLFKLVSPAFAKGISGVPYRWF